MTNWPTLKEGDEVRLVEGEMPVANLLFTAFMKLMVTRAGKTYESQVETFTLGSPESQLDALRNVYAWYENLPTLIAFQDLWQGNAIITAPKINSAIDQCGSLRDLPNANTDPLGQPLIAPSKPKPPPKPEAPFEEKPKRIVEL